MLWGLMDKPFQMVYSALRDVLWGNCCFARQQRGQVKDTPGSYTWMLSLLWGSHPWFCFRSSWTTYISRLPHLLGLGSWKGRFLPFEEVLPLIWLKLLFKNFQGTSCLLFWEQMDNSSGIPETPQYLSRSLTAMWGMEGWRRCLREWLRQLTASGPRSCRPRSASPGRPSTPQTGCTKGASGGYFGGSPGGQKGRLNVTQCAGDLSPLTRVASQGLRSSRHTRCPLSLLQLIILGKSLPWALSQQLPSYGHSKAITRGATRLRAMDLTIQVPLLIKIRGKFKASLSVGIWDHRSRDAYVNK